MRAPPASSIACQARRVASASVTRGGDPSSACELLAMAPSLHSPPGQANTRRGRVRKGVVIHTDSRGSVIVDGQMASSDKEDDQVVQATALRDDIDEIMPGVVADRRDLHEHPELAFQEVRTAGIVADRLRALGVE